MLHIKTPLIPQVSYRYVVHSVALVKKRFSFRSVHIKTSFIPQVSYRDASCSVGAHIKTPCVPEGTYAVALLYDVVCSGGFAYPVYVVCSVFFERAKIISNGLIQKIFPENFWKKNWMGDIFCLYW